MSRQKTELDKIFEEVINTRGIYSTLGYHDRFPVLTMRQRYKKGEVGLEQKIQVLKKAGYEVGISITKK